MRNGFRLEKIIQSYIDNRSVLGLSVAIVDGDEVVYARGFGLADAEEGRIVTTGTLFDVGSIAKTALSTLILRLVEAGRFDLDAPVMNYLPGLTFSDPDLGRTVTLRHLLSHTSGLPSAGKDWGPPEREALGRFAHEQLSRYAFVAEPGRIHLYSNTAVTLAGYIAEVVTGRSYRDLVREVVCLPLGMDCTTFDRAIGLGLWTDAYRGERVVRHSGVSQSFNSYLDLFPDRHPRNESWCPSFRGWTAQPTISICPPNPIAASPLIPSSPQTPRPGPPLAAFTATHRTSTPNPTFASAMPTVSSYLADTERKKRAGHFVRTRSSVPGGCSSS